MPGQVWDRYSYGVNAWLALCLLAAPEDRVLLDRIVATVNDDIVTLSELRTAAKPFLARNKGEKKRQKLAEDILNRLVEERLVDQQIEEANISVSEREIDQQIDGVLDANRLTFDELKNAIESYGMTMEKYREEIRQQYVRRKLYDIKVRSRIIIPEEDLRLEYEKKMRKEKPKVKIRIAHIVLPYDQKASSEKQQTMLEVAKNTHRRVTEASEDFNEVAKELSQGPTAKTGGELAEMSFENLMPELASAVEQLEQGQVSAPIVTRTGIQILKLLERREEQSKTFEEMRNQLYAELNQKRMNDEVQQWIKEVRRKSDVALSLDGVKL